jgi:hypothetical protein
MGPLSSRLMIISNFELEGHGPYGQHLTSSSKLYHFDLLGKDI